MEGSNPLTMSLPLHPTMEGTNPLTMSEWHCTYIRPARRNGQHSHLTWKELNPLAMNRMVQPLRLIKWEHIPLSHQNGFSVLD